MPLVKKIIDSQFQIAVWKIEEPIDYFLNKLCLSANEEEEFEKLKNRKSLEWASVRYISHLLSGANLRVPIVKDQYGKPHPQDDSYVSFSHSNGYAAVINSPHVVGIDIQTYVKKIERIKEKYLSPKELESISPDNQLKELHATWGAKESLFKCYGKGSLDFRGNIQLDFNYDQNNKSFKGKLIKNNISQEYKISYIDAKEYMLVYAI